MALSTGTLTVTKKWWDGKKLHVIGTIAIGASPLTYATGGIVTSLATAGVQSTLPPLYVHMNGRSGFVYKFIPGTTIVNGLLMIFTEAAVAANQPLTEHTVAAIVAGVSGDIIDFYGIFEMR